VTAYLLESSLAWFKKCRVLFYNYCVFARVKIENRNILLLLSSLFLSSSIKESLKFIFSRNFPTLVTCKSSKFVTKETLLLLPQTPWHLLKPPINFISRWRDLLTDVGYNFGQVKISTFNTSRWNALQLYLSPFSLYACDNLVHTPSCRDFSCTLYKPQELRGLFVDATQSTQGNCRLYHCWPVLNVCQANWTTDDLTSRMDFNFLSWAILPCKLQYNTRNQSKWDYH